jgi:hypothetical protein
VSYSPSHIDAIVSQAGCDNWRFTGFYGNPEVAQRHHSWELLRQLNRVAGIPWLVMGDFNEVLLREEHLSRLERSSRQIASFREAVADCSLYDLGYQGTDFTWTNRRGQGALVRARLDRGMTNIEWSQLYPNAVVSHFPFVFSDHLGLMLDMEPVTQVSTVRRRKLFRFEHYWVVTKVVKLPFRRLGNF